MGRLDDPQTEGRLLLGMADFLTVLLLTAGSALAFLSGYNVKTDLGAVLFFCTFASVVSTVLHSLARSWWSITVACVIALIFWPAWETVSPVLCWLGLKLGLGSILTGLPLWISAPEEETLLPVLLLLCAALAWIMGWMAVRVRRWYLAALLSFALVLPAIQMGVLPMWGAMLAAFAGWGTMLLTALYGRRDPGGLGRAQLLSLGGMCALLLVLVMALPMDNYLRPQWATDARNNMIQGITRRLDRYFDLDKLDSGILNDLGLDLSLPEESSGAGGGAAGGGVSTAGAFGGGSSWRQEDLLSLGPRKYQNRQVMRVTTDDPGASGQMLYLLGGTLNTYTGESWKYEAPATEQPVWRPAQPAWFPALTAPDAEGYTMTIRYTNLYGTWYYPYRLTGGGEPDESGRLSDVSAYDFAEVTPEEVDGLPDRNRMYAVTYRPGGPEDGFTELPADWQAAEQDYRHQNADFEEIYLDVPDTVRQTLNPLLSRERWEMMIASLEQGLDTLDGDARVEQEENLRQLREMINNDPTLDDLGGMVEITDEMDFWERYDASITAASRTAQLLSEWAVYDLDTPAMEPGEDFVEHFLEEGRGYCVHFATAGVLLLRMQGIPARYAAGYITELNSMGSSRVLDSDAHAWAEIYLDGYGWYPVEMTPGYGGGDSGVELAGEPEADIPDDPEEPEPDEIPEEEPDSPESEDLAEEELSGEEIEETGIDIPWRTLGRIALVLAALGGVYALALLVRWQARADTDVNRSVINAYRRYGRALRLGGVEDEVMEELARKAKFSQHTLTEEERAAVWQCLEQAVKTARRRQKKGMRILLKLLRPLL